MWNVLPMLRWSFQWRIETSVLCIARLNGRYWANNRITWAKNSTITLWRREAKHHHQQPMATSCWAIGIMQLDTQAVVESAARWFVWGHRYATVDDSINISVTNRWINHSKSNWWGKKMALQCVLPLACRSMKDLLCNFDDFDCSQIK